MADFEKVIRKHVNDEGSIPADSIPALVQSIQKAVGEGFVTIDRYNAKKTQAEELQTKLEEAESWKGKHDKLKSEYDAYKSDQENKEVRSQKQDAYKEILKKVGIPEKRFGVILKTVNLDELKMKDGKFDDETSLEKSIKEEWSDFIVSTTETGVDSAKPPANNGGKTTMTKKEIMEIKDTAERQKAIAENHELFGF